MVAAVAITPASGSITAKSTVCRVTASGLRSNTPTGYDATHYPSEPQVKYVFEATLAGQSDLVSPVLSTNADGICAWDDVIFPAAGSWTLAIEDTSDDSTAATTSVTVS